MPRLPLTLAMLLTASAAAAQAPPAMTLQQRMLLRCSAVFAIVAGEQQRGAASTRAYPPLSERGREYFVRAGARLMDELHLSREQIDALLRAEADSLQRGSAAADDPAKFVDGVMQPCLSALDASGI